MYAYIDESGNTGRNLFDPAQPVFSSGVLMSRDDFDDCYAKQISSIARIVGQESLHASELGVYKLEKISLAIRKLLQDSQSQVFIARAIKYDVAIIKFYDTIFDPAENLAVPWQTYNLKPLRFLLLFKVAFILDTDCLKVFWECLMDEDIDRARARLIEVLRELSTRIE